MSEELLKAIGWLGQGFFFSRFLLQWLASERAKGIVVPPLFWWFSLLGALCTLTYALSQRELLFLAAPMVNVFLYGRNLVLQKTSKGLDRDALLWAGFGVASLVTIVIALKLELTAPLPWLLVGLVGNLLWIARFPLQWLYSERLGRSELPTLFFQASLGGSVLLLSYAIWVGNPIFIAAYALGPFLYGRTLWLSLRDRRNRSQREAEAARITPDLASAPEPVRRTA